MKASLLSFCAVFLACLHSVFSAEWSYKENIPGLFGPSQWGRVSGACNGRRQSPIDLTTVTNVFSVHPVRIHNSQKQPSSTTVRNDGHGFAMSLNFNDGTRLSITGGPLGNCTYFLHDFHIHWGSEHTIGGHVFDAELHLVHYNSKYPDIKTALDKSDGLAVLGVFLKLDKHRDEVRPMINSALRVKEFGSPRFTETKPQNLFTLYDFLKRKTFRVWSYLGSLTTPKCNEVVKWLLSRNSVPIYKSELAMLKQMKSDHGEAINTNRRPTQPLNGRIVTQY